MKTKAYFLVFGSLLIIFFIVTGTVLNSGNIADKIIPAKKVGELLKTRNIQEKIYILDLQKGTKHLIYYGTDHTFDPNNPMYDDIEKKFVGLNPQIAFNEGGNVPAFTNRSKAITTGGEPGFMGYLGRKYKVKIMSAEPSSKIEFKYLLKKYKKDDILLVYLLRQIPQYQQESKYENRDFTQYMNDLMDSIRNEGFPATKEEMSIVRLKFIYKKYFNAELIWETFSFMKMPQTPKLEVIGNILYSIIDFRDIHIVNLLKNNFKKYDRIFIEMGSDHALKTEPALQFLFK